jgi:hypothetical protein
VLSVPGLTVESDPSSTTFSSNLENLCQKAPLGEQLFTIAGPNYLVCWGHVS